MKIYKYLAGLMIAVLATTSIYAQDGNNTLFLLPNATARYKINAAYQPEFKVVVGIPVLSGFNVNLFENSFSLEDVLTKKSTPFGDSTILDIDKLRSNMSKDFRVHFAQDLNILSVAFKTGKKGYSSISIDQKSNMGFGFGAGLIDFLAEGNTPYIGRTQDLGGIHADATAYVEAALGYSRVIKDKWTVGGRLKFLFGAVNANIKNSDIEVETDANGENMILRSKQEIYISAPITGLPTGKIDLENAFDDVDFDENAIGNMGFAVDLGASYRMNDNWNFGVAVNDLGFINWKKGVYKLTQDASFKWEGADVSNSINKNDSEYREIGDVFDDLVDSLSSAFQVIEGENVSYTQMLKANVNLYATYNINKRVNFGALLRGVMMSDKFYPSMTLSANTRPLKNLGISVSYSVYQGNYANVGVGIAPRFGGFQPYLVVDNILAMNFTKASGASMRFGINFVGSALYGKKAVKRGTARPWRAI